MTEHAPSHDTSDAHHAGADHGHGDHGGVGQYLAVFAALCVLTSASFFTYSRYWPFDKHVAWAFMMAVSCTKAMLVIMFFMHLKYEANWKWVLTIPASFMSIFLMLMLVPDVGLRKNNGFAHYSYERNLYAADPAEVTEPIAEAAKKELSHDAGPGGTH